MLNHLKIRSKLVLLVGPLIVLIATLGYIAENAFLTGQSAMNTVYEDRVVPLRDLKVISDMYAVNIVDTAHKARAGTLTRDVAITNIQKARSVVKERWSAYLATYLVEKERGIVEEVKPRMSAADKASNRLELLLKEGKDSELAAFISRDLYPAIDPVSDKLSELIDLQIDVAKENTLTTTHQFESSRHMIIAIILGSVLLSILASWQVIRAITKPIAEVRDTILKMADGDLSVSIIDDGRRDESGQMIRATIAIANTLQAVSHDLSELIEAAQSGTLSVRADPSRHKGEFAKLVSGANSLLGTLAQPLNEVAAVMAKLAAGDVKGRMSGDYAGELRALKGNVNRSLDILVTVLDAVSLYASALADGNLTQTIEGSFQGEFAGMKLNLNKAVHQLRNVLTQVSQATEHVNVSSKETTAAAVEVSRHAASQMATLLDVSGAIEQTASAISDIAGSADRARILAQQAVEAAQGGQSTLIAMTSAVHSIAEKNIRITQISELISSIADKTYVLALNAGLEAARAGADGGGFGLIANKISALAEDVAVATREIRSLVQEATSTVDSGVETAGEAKSAMVQIVGMSQQSDETIQSIAAAIEEQSAMMQLIKDRVVRLQTVAQTTASASEEISATMQSLTALSQHLQSETDRLRTT
ncbi:methyl-accepting chemotaxis protein [Limnohabitans sp. Jir72]|uniref:HAMP domain-containing methyl-accepting chemotaxis protein n=1 Tax=Limnohabitans sp. Jir72 TaxID=1977909 RepID=UPI000D3B4B94|nr:methyl-accepting chemotaxis protein [Limnohabitans sp. Jir72]PUE36079.1 methyl-accepting chemotaxis protein [Limnohabitans sp. Jir72]